MLVLTDSSHTMLRTAVRVVSRLGAFCGVAAMLVFTTGCDPCMNNPCNDGAACNGTETCTADGGQAVCGDGTAVVCDAGTCCAEPDGLCVDPCLASTCDDAVFCNGEETCTADCDAEGGAAGVCGDGTAPCAEGETCLEDTDECVECIEDVDCDDASECTADACAEGVCEYDGTDCGDQMCDPATGDCVDCVGDTDCDDGLFCNGAETCVESVCVDGDEQCNRATETCDEQIDACYDPVCTDDVHCDDGLYCNGAETCNADGLCEAGADPCDDGLFCTGTATCDEETDTCTAGTNPCGDGECCDEDTAECQAIVTCADDTDCPDDGLFCNGTESCDLVSGCCDSPPGCCVHSGDPCDPGYTCNEELNTCGIDPVGCFYFTVGVDELIGTDADDCFSSLLLFNAPTGTYVPPLQTGDYADGRGGTDTLDARYNFGTAATVSPTLISIEIFDLTDFGTAATTLAGGAITGVTDINLANSTNTNAFTVNALAAAANLGITQQAVGATLAFTAAATGAGDDSTTVSLNGMTAGTVTLTTGTTNGFETLNIASNNAASTVTDIAMNGTTLHTVNVTGDANFTLTTTLDANVTTVNCTGATGNVSLMQSNGGAFTYTGGAGDDSLNLDGTYGTTDAINGGDGSDTLGGRTWTLGGTTVAQTNVTNVEKLRMSDAHTTALNVSHFASITDVILDQGSNGGTITNGTNGLGVTLGTRAGTAAGAGALTATIAGSGVADTLTCTLNDAEQAGTVTFTGAETVNLVSDLDLDGSAANTGTAGQNTFAGTTILTDTASSERLVITGTEQMNLTGAVTMDVIDASGFTQPLIMGAACTKAGVTVTGGSGNDTLWASAGNDILGGGAGNDTLNPLAGTDIVTGGTGADTFRQSADGLLGVDRQTITDFDDTITTGDVYNFNFAAGALTGADLFMTSAALQTHATAGAVVQAATTNLLVVTSATVTDFTSANSLNGTNLLTAIGGTVTAAIAGQNDFLLAVADVNGDVGIYSASSADNAVIAAEITLVAVLQGADVAVGDLIFQNFGNAN